MKIRIIILALFLFLTIEQLNAAQASAFLLRPDDTTSFMNYELHKLALEAAEKKDYQNAFRIYLKIANKGDEKAEYNIGIMYMKGIGVESKKMDAYKWLRRAAKHGNKEANLYFKEMNDRYEQKHQIPHSEKKTLQERNETKIEEEKAEVKIESNISTIAESEHVTPDISQKTLPIIKEKIPEQNDTSLIYMLFAFILLVLLSALFFLKKTSKIKEEKAPQSTQKYKSQLYDITYAHITNYQSELLRHVDISRYESEPKKMQIYYMFLAGAIDYFCRLEEFSDSEQRRIFNTHMGKQEGKENVTAITQAILEGQRDHSLYHCQAAGGVSAQQWHEKKSESALLMLEKLLTEEKA